MQIIEMIEMCPKC